MSILKLFSGPSIETLEQKGDALSAAERWGEAKQAYERAVNKLEKRPEADADAAERIAGKVRQVKEALARTHQQSAEDYIAGGYLKEARELLVLASEITADVRFKQVLEDRLQAIDSDRPPEIGGRAPALSDEREDDDPVRDPEDEDDYFYALCGPLPEAVQDAYAGYGRAFRTGFIALNRQEFETAAAFLERALESNPRPDSYIPLELAVAYLNLGRSDDAQMLLEGFLNHHADVLPAYRLLCDIYWEQRDFERADALLASVPEDLSESAAVVLLKGETRVQAGHLEAARDFFRDTLTAYGWNEPVALALAKTHEALNEGDRARGIYKEIMDNCSSCRTRVDPMVKHKYAESCFAAGMETVELLEVYLSLSREVPDRAALYYDRISRIYAARGNAAEAGRFRAFAAQAAAGLKGAEAVDPHR